MAYNQNPYGSPPTTDAGYSSPYTNPEQHELQAYPYGSSTTGTGAATTLSQQEFLSRVSSVRAEIRSMAGDVQRIGVLQQQVLAGTGTADDTAAQRQLDDLVATTQQRNSNIRNQILELKTDADRTPSNDGSVGSTKKNQWEAMNRDFQKELSNYLQEEKTFRDRYRDQIARQYRIVNPDASEEEVRRAADMDWGNEGVFQTALRSNRTGQASAVLGSVRARHNELLNIEQSMTVLAQMMADLDTLVVQQQPLVENIAQQTDNTVTNLENGNKEIDIAAAHARKRRLLKWICLGLTILIILGVALGVGLGVGLVQKAAGVNNNNGGNATKVRRLLDELVVPMTRIRRELAEHAAPSL